MPARRRVGRLHDTSSLANEMLKILVIFDADVLEQFGVRKQAQRLNYGPRFGVCLRVVHCDFDIHMTKVFALETLGNAQVFGRWMPQIVQPDVVIEPGTPDDKCVRLAKPCDVQLSVRGFRRGRVQVGVCRPTSAGFQACVLSATEPMRKYRNTPT